MSGPAVSVVVPTRDRPAALRNCLAALGAQTIAARMEVIVVDDGSANPGDVEAVVADAKGRLVRAAGNGPAAARNDGIAAARGDVVLLTDDDCRPSPDWAELLEAALAAHGGVVRGTTVPSRPHDTLLVANEVIVEQLSSFSEFASTSNLACRRALLREHPFDARFPTAAGEDREWCLRLVGLGVPFAHEAAAIVYHDAEMGLGAFWRRHVRYGRAARRLSAMGAFDAGTRRAGVLQLRVLRAGIGSGVRVGAAVTLSQLATVVGYLQEGRGRH